MLNTSVLKIVNTMIPATAVVSQSAGLRARHTQLHADGKHLCMDSTESEATLKQAMDIVLKKTEHKIKKLGGTMRYVTSMSLYDCQNAFHKAGGPPPNPANKCVSMRPDGGIIFAKFGDVEYPVFIGEDKVQGTNDSRLAEKKPRQATGNAIERAAKNIRGCEMLCAHMQVFPYVIFASGCDFHSSETIAKRIEMMNLGVPNHYFGVDPSTTPETLDTRLQEVVGAVSTNKVMGHGIASVFVKAHKWDEMAHGSSRWRMKEIVALSDAVIDQALASVAPVPVADEIDDLSGNLACMNVDN